MIVPNQAVRVGQSVSFTCRIQNGNLGDISWFRNQRNISALYQTVDGGVGEIIAILRLARVVAEDAGEYECRFADLGVGYLASMAWLNVLGRLDYYLITFQ